MSRRPRPHILTVALLLSALVGAAFFAVGCKASDKPGAAIANGAPEVDDDLGEPDAYEPDLPAAASANYETIAERDVFRPLVVNRRETGGGESGGGGGTASPKSATPAATPEPPKPPDPTADIALTGIIETTDGLEVLLENIKTGEGHFAAVGETVFGLQVIEVGPGTVALKQADKDYALKLGEKEIATEKVASASSDASSESTPSTSSASSGSSASPSSSGGEPDWRGMSSEARRAYWENMSEADRNAMRERMRARYGGGRGGGMGGGSYRGRGGR